MQQAMALKLLKHPHICTYKEFFVHWNKEVNIKYTYAYIIYNNYDYILYITYRYMIYIYIYIYNIYYIYIYIYIFIMCNNLMSNNNRKYLY